MNEDNRSKIDRIRDIVKALYASNKGNNMRALKKSNSETLVKTVMDSTNEIVTVGLFTQLVRDPRVSKDDIDIICNSKRNPELNSLEFRRKMASLILEYEHHPDVYCNIAINARNLLEALASGKDIEAWKEKYIAGVLKLRTVFPTQERYKICG